MRKYHLWTCCLLLVLGLRSSSSWSIASEHASLEYVRQGNVSMLIPAGVTLEACECRVHSGENHPVIDLSKGRETPLFIDTYYNASYNGAGLDLGQCGVTLSNLHFGYALLVCRARASHSGWQYTEARLLRDGYSQFRIRVQPSHSVVLPGSDASTQCKAVEALKACLIEIPSETSYVKFRNASEEDTAQGRYRYRGSGLRFGDCGMVLANATEADSGPIWCGGSTADATSRGSWMSSTLIVAGAPLSDPVLEVTTGTNYTEGDTLEATCHVSGGRPVANITWLLGDRVIRQDQADDVPDAAWTWPWDRQAITQTVNYTLRLADNGTQLRCRVDHLAMDGVKEVTQMITVNAWPLLCGKKGRSTTGLVAGGNDSVAGEYPWHAGIYKQDENGYKHVCGGTLVTRRMVVTAAHCFWNFQQGKLNSYNPGFYKVGLGRIHLSWDVTEEDEQKMDVQQVLVLRRYAVSQANLQHDIAIVLLATPVNLTRTVNVVCVDWGNLLEQEQLAKGRKGIVTGWGLTIGGKSREVLQSVSLPWVPESVCWQGIPKERRNLFTFDKFCAGFVNRSTSVCGGDSGGGLVFQDDVTQGFYLRGVVSTSFAPVHYSTIASGCYAQHYTGFTRVSEYIGWLRQYRYL